MNAEQCRAARSLLNISRSELAVQAGASFAGVTNFELNGRVAPGTGELLQKALEARGAEFSESDGIVWVGAHTDRPKDNRAIA